jgi:glycosyltransferase involved in cell wall biosynthesis
VIPNGVELGPLLDNGVKKDEPNYILFCGTLYSPHNVDGLLWSYNRIWPLCKHSFANLKLLVLGSGKPPGSLCQLSNDKSVTFTGTVADVKPWYNKAAIAVVPLLTGSGTRLKILEAMSYGLPVISTTKGAEGIACTHGLDILVADKENDFAGEIMGLLEDKNKRIFLQKNARRLVEEKYDWNIIGIKMKNYINNISRGESPEKLKVVSAKINGAC